MGDLLIQELVTSSRPRTSVSITELGGSDASTFSQVVSFKTLFSQLCSFKEEGASVHRWLHRFWHQHCLPRMHYPQSVSQTRFTFIF